jgi:hypothetical protein
MDHVYLAKKVPSDNLRFLLVRWSALPNWGIAHSVDAAMSLHVLN